MEPPPLKADLPHAFTTAIKLSQELNKVLDHLVSLQQQKGVSVPTTVLEVINEAADNKQCFASFLGIPEPNSTITHQKTLLSLPSIPYQGMPDVSQSSFTRACSWLLVSRYFGQRLLPGPVHLGAQSRLILAIHSDHGLQHY